MRVNTQMRDALFRAYAEQPTPKTHRVPPGTVKPNRQPKKEKQNGAHAA